MRNNLQLVVILSIGMLLPINYLSGNVIDTIPVNNDADKLMHSQNQAGEVPLDSITKIGLLLEKNKLWESETEKNIKAKLNIYTGQRQITVIHKLLNNDFTGVGDIFSANYQLAGEPPWQETLASIKVLRDNGYSSAADVLSVLCVGVDPGQRILAWVRLPAEGRKVIDGIMLKRYPFDDLNRRQLVLSAAELVTNPPKDTGGVTQRQMLDFARWLDHQGTHYLNFDMAIRWLQAGKKDAGIELIESLLADQPGDPATVARAVSLLRSSHEPGRALAAYNQALAVAPEPVAREIRLGYLGFLAYIKQVKMTVPGAHEIADLQKNADHPLLAADALLAGGKFLEASDKYIAILRKKSTLGPERLSAWSGLLDADPNLALQNLEVNDKLDIIDKENPTQRPALIRWMAQQISKLIERQMPLDPGSLHFASTIPYQKIAETTNWKPVLTSTMEHLLAIDPATCLAFGQQKPSIRETAVLIYALAGQNDKARQTLMLKAPGIEGANSAVNSPFPAELLAKHDSEEITRSVMETMTRFQTNTTTNAAPIPLNSDLIQQQATALKNLKDKNQAASQMNKLIVQFKLAINSLDPPPVIIHSNEPAPPIREVKMEYYQTIDAAIRDALTNPLAASEIPTLVYQGLIPALSLVRNPNLLQALLTLTTTALDRNFELTKSDYISRTFASNICNILEHHQDVSIKELAQPIREKYLK